jgi:hypothetical protein
LKFTCGQYLATVEAQPLPSKKPIRTLFVPVGACGYTARTVAGEVNPVKAASRWKLIRVFRPVLQDDSATQQGCSLASLGITGPARNNPEGIPSK